MLFLLHLMWFSLFVTSTPLRFVLSFSAVVRACCVAPELAKNVREIQASCRFGCGRQAVRHLDRMFQTDADKAAIRAARGIRTRKWSSAIDLEEYLSKFRIHRLDLGQGEHRLTNKQVRAAVKQPRVGAVLAAEQFRCAGRLSLHAAAPLYALVQCP